MRYLIKEHWPSVVLLPIALLIALALFNLTSAGQAGAGRSGQDTAGPSRLNGFDISNAIIPKSKILSGGPPRDGIPSIDAPKFIEPEDVDYLKADDRVVSVTVDNETRAYPLRILSQHEIVNDTIGDRAFAVTYCPLCGTAMVFDREIQGERVELGVSGLLYNSDVLMYDRKTESLWSQLAMKAVSGPLAGMELEWLPSEQLTWKKWKSTYPDGHVLSTDTGYQRDYGRELYPGYETNQSTYFPYERNPIFASVEADLLPKTKVVGVIQGGQAKAYPLKRLRGQGVVHDRLGGAPIEVRYDSSAKHPEVRHAVEDKPIPYVEAYWFAWQAFYPGTAVWGP